ncbi:MAG: pyruvate, phosphate dikinase, partial [Planctomycetes bacterium]|nr:pyruvate, phosphate dikinase [Planctomycetota bacterium]
IEEQFNNILDYFGQFPFIVRSSSLLEDNFGNAFAGKYESVFCVNQGPREQRIAEFVAAVRQIYTSSMSEEALIYRDQRGLLDQDEQMALLVQRVSGTFYDELYLPQAAGVGFSHNPYVWDENIDPEAGVMRLAFGLGTRAVDRHDDEYIRIMALNTPERRPETASEAVRQYCQKRVDVLDLLANKWTSCDFAEVMRRSPSLPIDIFATRDWELEQMAKEKNLKNVFPWCLTFDKLVKDTDFVERIREMLSVLQAAYDYPVDIEFTCNFFDEKQYYINLVQCRPFQIKDGGTIPDPPSDIEESDLILKAHGAVIGRSRVSEVERFVYVTPSMYGELGLKERYTIARLIGKLMHVRRFYEDQTIMLLGPGRWGTTSPELGVPISFSEINTVSLLCEIVAMREDLVPDVSLGTHLFSEMVEMDILYLALFPNQENNYLNQKFFEESSNHVTEYLPEAAKWSKVLRVVEAPVSPACLNANTMSQNVVCYLG